MSGFRVFLQWAGSVESVPEKLMIPRVRGKAESRDDLLEPERSDDFLAHLSRYKYSSLHHLLLELLWETGMRVGAAHSLDIGDIDLENERVSLVHRPDQDTTLKNGRDGERLVALSPELTQIIKDYIDMFGMMSLTVTIDTRF